MTILPRPRAYLAQSVGKVQGYPASDELSILFCAICDTISNVTAFAGFVRVLKPRSKGRSWFGTSSTAHDQKMISSLKSALVLVLLLVAEQCNAATFRFTDKEAAIRIVKEIARHASNLENVR